MTSLLVVQQEATEFSVLKKEEAAIKKLISLNQNILSALKVSINFIYYYISCQFSIV